jgi:hypothetical protein
MVQTFFFVISLIGLTLQATEGFVPAQVVVAGDVTILPIQTPTSFTATARKEVPQSPLRQTSFLSMTEGPSDESLERRKKQQIGAVAVLLFGVLFDFFVTHHGVGFWDPNYIV